MLAHYGGTYIDLDDVSSPREALLSISFLTSCRVATVAWILFWLIPRGFAALHLLVSRMTLWALCLNTHSSFERLRCCSSMIVTGSSLISRSCTQLARCSCLSSGKSTCAISQVRQGAYASSCRTSITSSPGVSSPTTGVTAGTARTRA